MSTAPFSGARRWAAFCLPIVVVVVLFLIGRRATNAATPPPPPVIAIDAMSHAADSAVDAPPEVARTAIEQLPDGATIVDLNLATEADLRKLPGVGPTRARKIVELRTQLGRFKSVDDLARIRGFGRATIRRLRPLTRASPP